ncbi:MAG: hypothetical protein KAJ20_03115 [Candidatus Aenigmarchaeota archaeon]|nr:hypothetical protein [Candidatus Aenigmarchaeota archaeon]
MGSTAVAEQITAFEDFMSTAGDIVIDKTFSQMAYEAQEAIVQHYADLVCGFKTRNPDKIEEFTIYIDPLGYPSDNFAVLENIREKDPDAFVYNFSLLPEDTQEQIRNIYMEKLAETSDSVIFIKDKRPLLIKKQDLFKQAHLN